MRLLALHFETHRFDCILRIGLIPETVHLPVENQGID